MSKSAFLAADWPLSDDIVAGTTLRSGGTSKGGYAGFNLGAHVGDDSRAVADNRRQLHNLLDLPNEPTWLQQVHGTVVVSAPCSDAEPVADACIANSPGTVCAVMTADCLPVLFARIDGQAVAAAHAGWRGLAAGVLEATIDAFECAPDRLVAWLGPAISQSAFEVGDEVHAQFVAQDSAAEASFAINAAGRWQADLYSLAKLRLNRCGVTAIFGGEHCTFTERDDFFSYRRDGQCGRMVSLVFRRN
ncbi:MAG: peptidoglycan editing factor PgeF [Gammaproteobacteria bacterium]|nr:peptidoglycan editing factor PgeF [Gammaproteobacteria bacterium]